MWTRDNRNVEIFFSWLKWVEGDNDNNILDIENEKDSEKGGYEGQIKLDKGGEVMAKPECDKGVYAN